ncbi:WDR61 [Lepeophtheirus salmonis]|uniref:WDR61 n=1 Tax=Lepeophtheirus salmonis TaxID=72036 RepID=A0A7R8H1U9_LEPSM|nr:WDR61 [Lepeophtheirus salmonis]CAF2801336.1 WDR61 [Lepeophtheirus salmonis]
MVRLLLIPISSFPSTTNSFPSPLVFFLIGKKESAHEDAIWSCAWGSQSDSNEETGGGPELKHRLGDHSLGVVSVALNKTSSLLASSSLDSYSETLISGANAGKVNIYCVETGQNKQQLLDTRGKFILSIAYSPDGKYIASGATDGIINIFSMPTGKQIHALEGHALPIRSLAFSKDSKRLLTGSDDGHMKLYEVSHGSLIGTLSGHTSWVLSVQFSPDNEHFVSGSSDRSVKVWESTTKQCVHTFTDHSDQVWAASYSPNGRKIATVSEDASILMYSVPA